MDAPTLSQMEVHPALYRPSAEFVRRIRMAILNTGVMVCPDPTQPGNNYSFNGADVVVHSAVYREVFKGWL